MLRVDALRAIYPELTRPIVGTNMGAAPAELFSLGHQPGFFYLWHSMGLASSVGLGNALSRPDLLVVVIVGDGSLLMNLGSLTTMARYRPANLIYIVFDNEVLLSVGRSFTTPLQPPRDRTWPPSRRPRAFPAPALPDRRGAPERPAGRSRGPGAVLPLAGFGGDPHPEPGRKRSSGPNAKDTTTLYVSVTCPRAKRSSRPLDRLHPRLAFLSTYAAVRHLL